MYEHANSCITPRVPAMLERRMRKLRCLQPSSTSPERLSP